MTVREIIEKNPESLIGRAFSLIKNLEPKNNRVPIAEILHKWRLDEATVGVSLIIEPFKKGFLSLDSIKKQLGEDVAFLAEGAAKLDKVQNLGSEARAENLRKLILALSQDLRVVFLKLAEELFKMRTIGALPPPEQKKIALETQNIYAPLALRLGMQNLSGELKDMAFPHLYPKEYESLKEMVKDEYRTREKYLKEIEPLLASELHKNNLKPVAIDFRAKRYSSLYEKLKRYEMDIEKIYDLVAMRIVMETIPECYAVLGIVHHVWPPVPGRIKDYIAMPKLNSYRSLHTTVVGPKEKHLEIQVKTAKMHEENENGLAGHWLYEQNRSQGKSQKLPKNLEKEIGWVGELRNWLDKYRGRDSSPEEFLGDAKIKFLEDRIFALTPKGDVIDLPLHGTPIDFAYHIHTEIGNAATAAKVNGKIVSLDTTLSSGDLVEILTQKNKKPRAEWLEFAKTSLAKDHIRAELRKKNQNLLKNLKKSSKK